MIRKFFFGYEEIDRPAEDPESISHYFANGQRVASRSSLTGLRYIHSDHLGSATRETDENGAVVWDVMYDPYGEIVYFTSSSENEFGFT